MSEGFDHRVPLFGWGTGGTVAEPGAPVTGASGSAAAR